jgi:hypothetical protein
MSLQNGPACVSVPRQRSREVCKCILSSIGIRWTRLLYSLILAAIHGSELHVGHEHVQADSYRNFPGIRAPHSPYDASQLLLLS